MERKVRVTLHDVIMAHFTGGDVRLMMRDHTDPVGTLNKAINKIKESNENADVRNLQDVKAAILKEKQANGTRGRARLENGETRPYKAQEVNGSVFIRLPLDCIKARKGDLISVTLENGVFKVTSNM
jgi:hypothetical protein